MSPEPPTVPDPRDSLADDKTPGPVHVYDGIEEHDNRLPSWWLGILYGTIVFAFGYWFVYQSLHARPGVWESYRVEAEAAAKRAAAAPLTDQAITVMAGDSRVLADGARLFQQTCAPCHAANAAGQVGPNLTDRFWLHGSAPTAIHRSIAAGFPTKGMPPWGQMLGQARVRTLAAYVVSLKGKNLPGKPAQGTEEP
jgi:cytochrome c oxidase cbb3-type subunit 3